MHVGQVRLNNILRNYGRCGVSCSATRFVFMKISRYKPRMIPICFWGPVALTGSLASPLTKWVRRTRPSWSFRTGAEQLGSLAAKFPDRPGLPP